MALETDKTTEARRKALRNGEEDPVVVSQRFLNIYRQKHILSPERQEAFNKMLLELSPEIRGMFSSLPGGAMLQDYADELAEKKGVEKSTHAADKSDISSEAHQQAQILATALAKAQAQSNVNIAPSAVAAPSKLSIDKEFADDFAKIIGNIMQEQASLHKESLEKLSANISQAQIYMADSIKEGRELQRQEIKDLCQAITDSTKSGMSDQHKDFEYWYQMMNENLRNDREDRRREINEISRIVIDGYRASRDAQREDIKELCKIIAKGQTALGTTLSNSIEQEISATSPAKSSDDADTKHLIEVVLDGQKQLGSRLDRVEELSAQRANDNKYLVETFTKSQAELIKRLDRDYKNRMASNQTAGMSVATEEKLQQLIVDSQEKLINKILAANVQQNKTSQANNNANNIQINAPDLSAPMMMLIDKISSLQASTEQNLEKAITKALQAQEETRHAHHSLDNSGDMQSGSLEEQPLSPLSAETMPEASSDVNEEIPEIAPLKEEVSDTASAETNQEASPDLAVETPKKKKKKRKKKSKVLSEDNQSTDTAKDILPASSDFDLPQEEISLDDLPNLPEDDLNLDNIIDDNNTSPAVQGEDVDKDMSILPDYPADDKEEPLQASVADDALAEATSEDNSSMVASNMADDETFGSTSSNHEADSVDQNLSEEWGFGSQTSEEKAIPVVNDNNQQQDWEWAYVESDDADDYEQLEAIGDNSYICSGDLSSQDKVFNTSPLIEPVDVTDFSRTPQIFDTDDEEGFIDPYQNSILKD